MLAGIRPLETGQINLVIKKVRNQFFSKYMHENIAYMPQKPIFHSTTILDYIMDGSLKFNNAKIKRIIKSLKIDNSFDMKLENLLKLVIGPTGYTPSGGQAKLLAFARALYKEDIFMFLLDEPTSDLNEELKENVLKAIYDLSKEKFVICITHDLNSIRKNDLRLRL